MDEELPDYSMGLSFVLFKEELSAEDVARVQAAIAAFQQRLPKQEEPGHTG